MNRVKDGFLLTRNPFNANQIKRISLEPKDVDAIIFWTRNPKDLIKHIPTLEKIGYRFYFQYTITGYPRAYESSTPKPANAIDTFCELSNIIGSNRVIWRYDPIILTNHLNLEEHKRLFSKIASMLTGRTQRVVISFADFYKKTAKNLEKIPDIEYYEITESKNLLYELVSHMKKVADSYGITIQSCSEDIDLEKFGVSHGKCIDDELLADIYNLHLPYTKDKNQREACGCIKSIDIGAYNTCLHGCSYCYATFNEKFVLSNRKKHDPNSPFLIGEIDQEYMKKYIPIQKSLL